MPSLHDDLEKLHRFNELREKATSLRNAGYQALSSIDRISVDSKTDIVSIEPLPLFDEWLAMGNRMEAALLLKIKRHWRLAPVPPPPEDLENLELRIKDDDLDALFAKDIPPNSSKPLESNDSLDRSVPILLAALCMQLLAGRSKTVLSKEMLLCYYRILVEMNVAVWPDWIIGAARAGEGATVSAFVTGECIRAVLALERSVQKTIVVLDRTAFLNERYQLINAMLQSIDGELGEQHPFTLWADTAMKRVSLDWYIGTDPQREAVTLDVFDDFPISSPTVKAVGSWLMGLPDRLRASTVRVHENFEEARKAIGEHHLQTIFAEAKDVHYATAGGNRNAREYGMLVIDRAKEHATALKDLTKQRTADDTERTLETILADLKGEFTNISREIHRVLSPSKRYVENVLDRALAEAEGGQFDHGELVFAAVSYGAATNWQPNQYLGRVCQLILNAIPASGMLVTRKPFHSTRRGYKLFPTGCDIIGSLALLLNRTQYRFEPEAVERLVASIETKTIPTWEDAVGWNFEGATDHNRPSVWVTAVTVLALDRIVRMLDARINSMVMPHFEVIRPEKPHKGLTLNDLIYPDYGLAQYCQDPPRMPISLRLERMRAHLSRVRLPGDDQSATGRGEKIFSAVLYGPPQTGKTTWSEALALSSGVPLLRLSPFDLTVSPPGATQNISVQARAKDVFEALSMLTQAVILFDEFEEALPKRGVGKSREGDIPFLLTGLLPKLVKLHDVAEAQGLVYCLATNHLEEIDDAAIRDGRFDVHIPIYHPDPLSRAATFMFRLQQLRAWARKAKPELTWAQHWIMDADAAVRFLEIVSDKKNISASELADEFFSLPKWVRIDAQRTPANWKKIVPCFLKVLTGEGECRRVNVPAPSSSKDVRLRPEEQVVRRWLVNYEKQFDEHLADVRKLHEKAAVTAAEILEALAVSEPEAAGLRT